MADTTVVVSVPESGDEIQTLKSGIMEIADVFVVNKSDRDGARTFANHLKKLAHSRSSEIWENPVVLTQALQNTGIVELAKAIEIHGDFNKNASRQIQLFAEKAFAMIQDYRMRDLELSKIKMDVEAALAENPALNLFEFIQPYLNSFSD